MRPFIGPALPTRESAPGLERTALRTDWMVSATSHVPHCKRAASTNRSTTIVHPNSGRVFQPERSERAQVCKQRDWWIMGMLNRSSRWEIGERTKTGNVEVSSALSLGYNVKCSIFSFSSLSLMLRCWCFVLLPIMHSRLQPRRDIDVWTLLAGIRHVVGSFYFWHTQVCSWTWFRDTSRYLACNPFIEIARWTLAS